MFSKLRPHHRRSGSTPTSPSPHQIPPGFLPAPPNSSHGPVSPPAADSNRENPTTFHFAKAEETRSMAAIADPAASLPLMPTIVTSTFDTNAEQGKEQVFGVGLGLNIRPGDGARAKTSQSLESTCRSTTSSPLLPRVDDLRAGNDHSFNFRRHDTHGSQESIERGVDGAGAGAGGDRERMEAESWKSRRGKTSAAAARPQIEAETPAEGLDGRGNLTEGIDAATARHRDPPGPGGLDRRRGSHVPPPLLPPQRKEGVSETEFRSILQEKRLPPLPTSAGAFAARKTYDVASRPPQTAPLPDRPHNTKVHGRLSPMPLAWNSSASVASSRASSSPTLSRQGERTGKNKLHLLNPMSLLMRRRTGQALDPLSDESLTTHRSAMSSPPLWTDYDPSIRGNKVHDFSAPRPRQFSSPNLPHEARRDTSLIIGVDSPREISGEGRHEVVHTPVFKEHFEDELDRGDSDLAVRAENLVNKDFLKRNSQQLLSPDLAVMVPPFASLGQGAEEKAPDMHEPSSVAPPVPAKDVEEVQEHVSALSSLIDDAVSALESDRGLSPRRSGGVSTIRQSLVSSMHSDRSIRTRPSTQSNRISRASSASGSNPNGLPSHMLSRASRFSFQYASNDSSAQEKLLEEKHREKNARSVAEERDRPDSEQIDEDAFAYEEMDMYDGEDDVPMNGDDWSYAEGGLGLGNLTLDDISTGMTGSGLGSMSLDDFSGRMGASQGIPACTSSLEKPMTLVVEEEKQETPGTGGDLYMPDSISINDLREEPQAETPPESGTETLQPTTAIKDPRPTVVDSFIEQDEFYFNSGEFADADLERDDGQTFDEDVFDDPEHPLYERKPVVSAPSARYDGPKRTTTKRGSKLRVKVPSERPPEHPEPDAPQVILSAYHDALALAATKAAAAGRFDRANSLDSSADEAVIANAAREITETEKDVEFPPRPDLISDDARFSEESTLSPPTVRASAGDEIGKSVNFLMPEPSFNDSFSMAFDYSDYDSNFEDDPMIAAANAEALEYDEDGDYGQEFGFYARPGGDNGSDESQYGGYFGPKNWGEIKRQRSTREPNLTPITELSEFSARNSFIGFGLSEHETGAQSPGLAALARLSPGWEGDITMEALRKLRRGAFGGSHSSLKMASSGSNSSAIASSSPSLPKEPRQVWMSPMRKEFTVPADTAEDDADDEGDYDDLLNEANLSHYGDDTPGETQFTEASPGQGSPTADSPTLCAQMLPIPSVSPIRLDGVSSRPDSDASSPTPQHMVHDSPTTERLTTLLSATIPPVSPSSATSGYKKGHSRSGSDHVAYVREKNRLSGEIRWVLERRRTGDDGVESLVGRTPVEGGRI